MKRESTEILKVKIDDKGFVFLDMQDTVMGWKSPNYESRRPCHSDLTDAIAQLNKYVAESNGMIIDIPEGSTKELVKFINKLNTKTRASVTATGVAIKGKGENVSVVITGKRSFLHTGGAMNSPNISLAGDTFGFESAIAPLLDAIIEEVKLYVFDGKGGLFGAKAEEEEPEKEKVEA